MNGLDFRGLGYLFSSYFEQRTFLKMMLAMALFFGAMYIVCILTCTTYKSTLLDKVKKACVRQQIMHLPTL